MTRDILEGEGASIMVVDDNQEILDLLEELLATYGYQVTTVRDGEQALSLLKNQDLSYDLLLTDIVMPGMTGIDLESILHEYNRNIPVIGISGEVNVKEYREQYSDRFDAFIQKPLIFQEVLLSIRTALQKH